MEKNTSGATLKKIVVIGPESTGKTTLAEGLARHFGTLFVPEYARGYVEALERPYCYEDLVSIANKQVEQDIVFSSQAGNFLFYDTDLIITKIWFDWVYGNVPVWMDDRIRAMKIDLYLLCCTDLPWEADKVRENPGENREKLFLEYQEQIKFFNVPCQLVHGFGKARLELAVEAVLEHFK